MSKQMDVGTLTPRMAGHLNVGRSVTGRLAICGSTHQLLLTFTFPSPPDMFPRLLDNVLVTPMCIHCLTHEERIPPNRSASEPDTPYTGHTVFSVSLLH
jgi:hypothetical protein